MQANYSGSSWLTVVAGTVDCNLFDKCSAVAEMGDRLTTIDMSQKLGAVPFFKGGSWIPNLTQCGLGRGLPSYLVASWSIQPFSHNRHGPKSGGCCAPFLGRITGSPSNTVWPGPKHTSIPSFILIYPTVWPQYTNITEKQRGQDRTTVR